MVKEEVALGMAVKAIPFSYGTTLTSIGESGFMASLETILIIGNTDRFCSKKKCIISFAGPTS
jgi:hypothetical protein